MNEQITARSRLKSAKCVLEALLDLTDQVADFKNRLCQHDPDAPGVKAGLDMTSEIEMLMIETLDTLRNDEKVAYDQLMVKLKG